MLRRSLVRSSEAKALEYLEVSSLSRDEMHKMMINTLQPADAKWVRRCAIRMALCRYVVKRAHDEKQGGIRLLLSNAKASMQNLHVRVAGSPVPAAAEEERVSTASVLLKSPRFSFMGATSSGNPPPHASSGDEQAMSCIRTEVMPLLHELARAQQELGRSVAQLAEAQAQANSKRTDVGAGVLTA